MKNEEQKPDEQIDGVKLVAALISLAAAVYAIYFLMS
jgi:hypothetical protein